MLRASCLFPNSVQSQALSRTEAMHASASALDQCPPEGAERLIPGPTAGLDHVCLGRCPIVLFQSEDPL